MAEERPKEDLADIQAFVDRELRSYDPAELEKLEELPFSLSINLIKLFVPYYTHYYFLMDISYFMARLLLPSSHPNSIHPCLLNACYLGACANDEGGLTSFQPFFLRRARRFLQHSLMFGDRTTDFLWASLALGVFFAKERRLLEAIAVAGATARFAVACGLNGPNTSVQRRNLDTSTSEYLLPPPVDKLESDDRIRLAHSIYIACQAVPLLSGNPLASPYDRHWSQIPVEASLESRNNKVSTTPEELWRSELYLKVLVTNTFDRVTRFARSFTINSHCRMSEEYLAIESQIQQLRAAFPPLYDPRGFRPRDVSSAFDSHSVYGCIALYGSGLILHSLWASYRVESRAKMFECVQALVDICAGARKHRRLYSGLVNAVHIMNAIRILAHELQRLEANANAALSISYCQSIEVLLDALDDIMLLFPAWVEAPVTLRGALIAAANSLSA
ncbi:hypothetical protein DL93DRAFT_2170666 [Clavulina sp. PMI_390]|nr:hypothetical protein DL93DRAFT_2170666 [Clavulina sp. PMI_390]